MPPLVSICMIAYNHQEFISEAIESVLAQDTNFPFELVIGDDNSKDNTERICRDYASRFPGKVRYFRREKNIGMMPNFIQTLGDCTGKYIAICEGDDYWTDKNKLQLQVDFLERNPDYSMCVHTHNVLTGGKLKPAPGPDQDEEVVEVTTEQYMLRPFFHTTSYFFRKEAQPQPYPSWYRDVLAGDHFLVLFISLKGKMACLNKRMSVFRNHGRSVSFSTKAVDIKDNFVKHLQIFDEYSNGRFHSTLDYVIKKWSFLYKVYEPVSYLKRLQYFISNLGYYGKHFRALGGAKTFIKYMIPSWAMNLRSGRMLRS